MENLIYPDGVRGVVSLLRGEEYAGLPLHPVVQVPEDVFNNTSRAVVHVQRMNVTEGDGERVEEVRLVVYGRSPLESQDIAEAILSMIVGHGVTTPASQTSAAFYFDSIRQRVGPSAINYPNDSVFPASAAVDLRSRPIPQ